ncbi:MAG TPA: hypothetical protein VLG16_00995 [Candidatus Saccharimonadales bacterium]|nr:hypothetical protein [Candidatus Saccharimonadales bacterium]
MANGATSYEFGDSTERVYTSQHDILDYQEDPELGYGSTGTILVKWTNQTYHDDNLRAMQLPALSIQPLQGCTL